LNAILKPYEELSHASEEISTMAELAVEDASFEAEIEPALVSAEKDLVAF